MTQKYPAPHLDVLTDEERAQNKVAMREIVDAIRQEGTEALDIAITKIKFASHVLMAIKKSMGADYIRSRKIDTSRADKVYGPGWLDQPDRPR